MVAHGLGPTKLDSTAMLAALAPLTSVTNAAAMELTTVTMGASRLATLPSMGAMRTVRSRTGTCARGRITKTALSPAETGSIRGPRHAMMATYSMGTGATIHA